MYRHQYARRGQKQAGIFGDGRTTLVSLFIFGIAGDCQTKSRHFVSPSSSPNSSFLLPPVQHYLTAFGAMIAIPLLLSEGLCLRHDGLTQSRLINTSFFVSGLCTVLQVTFGVRLGCCCSLITIRMFDNIRQSNMSSLGHQG